MRRAPISAGAGRDRAGSGPGGEGAGRAAAAILVLEGIAVLFVPRAIAPTDEGLSGGRLTALLVLAVVLILAAGCSAGRGAC